MAIGVSNGSISGLQTISTSQVGIAQYDPKSVLVFFGGVPLSEGLSSNTFITAKRTEATFQIHVGTDGEVIRTRTNNTTGMYQLTYRKGSSNNTRLSAIHTTDETTGLIAVPMLLIDFNGATLVASTQAWIRDYAEVVYQTDEPTVTWTFDSKDMALFNSGLSGAQP